MFNFNSLFKAFNGFFGANRQVDTNTQAGFKSDGYRPSLERPRLPNLFGNTQVSLPSLVSNILQSIQGNSAPMPSGFGNGNLPPQVMDGMPRQQPVIPNQHPYIADGMPRPVPTTPNLSPYIADGSPRGITAPTSVSPNQHPYIADGMPRPVPPIPNQSPYIADGSPRRITAPTSVPPQDPSK